KDVRFDVYIADQSDGAASYESAEAIAVIRVLEASGHAVTCSRNLPRHGMAHQRHYLLEQARAPYVLFLDDDVILQGHALPCMLGVIRREHCGLVANAVIGLSYRDEVRPHQQQVELWTGPVQPEKVEPGDAAWNRHLLHNAANLWHVQQALGVSDESPVC